MLSQLWIFSASVHFPFFFKFYIYNIINSNIKGNWMRSLVDPCRIGTNRLRASTIILNESISRISRQPTLYSNCIITADHQINWQALCSTIYVWHTVHRNSRHIIRPHYRWRRSHKTMSPVALSYWLSTRPAIATVSWMVPHSVTAAMLVHFSPETAHCRLHSYFQVFRAVPSAVAVQCARNDSLLATATVLSYFH